MLNIIQPKSQNLHKSTVESFLGLLKKHQNVDLTPAQRKQSTFVIAENEQWGIYGGAVLYPQHIWLDFDDSDIQEDLLRLAFVTFRPMEQEFWMARICFCPEEKALNSLTTESVELCGRFYHELYKTFLEVGQQNDIEFLGYGLVALPPFTLPFYEDWPHRTPVSYSSSCHPIFYSILALQGTKFFPRKLRKIDRSPIGEREVNVTAEGRA